MSEIRLRSMESDDWLDVAGLICVSTNAWYEAHGMPRIFRKDPDNALIYPQVYEALDPGCCVIAERSNGRLLMGSCFYHPRETHFSLGIMNVHPNFFGRGVGRRLLEFIIERADVAGKPIRLVSSAMNLDSFSLYNRAGFVPRRTFQDMILDVPEEGIVDRDLASIAVREATLDDVAAMAKIEEEVSGIHREKDYRYFIDNPGGYWKTLVSQDKSGDIDGFLVSIDHPGVQSIGPGVARTEKQAAALLLHQLNRYRGRCPLFLVPVDCPDLVKKAYAWGGRNCEFHFAQVRGDCEPFRGVVLPTFLPETG